MTDPGSPGSDLNPVIRTDCMCYVKCAEAYIRVQIAQARVEPIVDCNKLFDPGSPGSDLNPVIRTDCMCYVKCAEAMWNYKSGRYSEL